MSTTSAHQINAVRSVKIASDTNTTQDTVATPFPHKQAACSIEDSPNGSKGGLRDQGWAKPTSEDTVTSLKPRPALTVLESTTVYQASQLCAANQEDCLIVVSDSKDLRGILTAEDVVYKVVAKGLDPHSITVRQIMTRNPPFIHDSSSTEEALRCIVSNRLQHLPVHSKSGNSVGLLDVIEVVHECLGVIERISEEASDITANHQSEVGSGVEFDPRAVVTTKRETQPDPAAITVLGMPLPVRVGFNASIRQVAERMKERRTSAVCVMLDPLFDLPYNRIPPVTQVEPVLIGILTSKDVVLRVVAADLDINKCLVEAVMTRNPDTAPAIITIHDVVRKMHAGRYFDLPVVRSDGLLVAVVDALKLARALVQQMESLWNPFFDPTGDDDDEPLSASDDRPFSPPRPLASLAGKNLFDLEKTEDYESTASKSISDTSADAKPSEYAPPLRPVVVSIDNENVAAIANRTPSPPYKATHVFTFRAPSGRTHRFRSLPNDFEAIRRSVHHRLATDPFFTEFPTPDKASTPDPANFTLLYIDEDGNSVVMSCNEDVTEAVIAARLRRQDPVELFVQGGKRWPDAGAFASGVGKEESKAGVNALASTSYLLAPSQPRNTRATEGKVRASTTDFLLPASIAALALAHVFIGLLALRKLTSASNH